jgi:hypothetical protein
VVVAQRNVKGVSEWFPAAALKRRRFDSPVWVAICKPHARLPTQSSAVGSRDQRSSASLYKNTRLCWHGNGDVSSSQSHSGRDSDSGGTGWWV